MTQLFFPAQQTPLVIALTNAVVIRWLMYRFKITLNIDPADVTKLKALKGDRVILFANHPTFHEPVVMYSLSTQVGHPFHYMTAVEQFQGMIGRFFQLIGAYSVRRGLSDRASIKHTLELLRRPQTHLVIFPEGGCTFQNDTVMPFRTGAIQLAFKALTGEQPPSEPAPLYAVPIAIKYRYPQTLWPALDSLMARLEAALALPPGSTQDRYGRLRAIAAAVLTRIEADYPNREDQRADSTPLDLSADWNGRIEGLRSRVLSACETALDIRTPENAPIRERTYQLANALANLKEKQSLRPEDEAKLTLSIATLEKSIQRLFNFDALYDGYVAAAPTPERFLDTLNRLEREVFNIDQPPIKGPRQAWVKIGDPICLNNWLTAYQGRDPVFGAAHPRQDARTAVIEEVTAQLERQTQAQLDALAKHSSGRIAE
jgi:1-acyl-sn-glycerol-3-phosphate acyltransferase